MADIKLKDRDALRQSEEDTAILAAVSNETNTGETRKVTIPGIAEAQHRENPLVAVWEETTLYEPAEATQPEISSPDSSTILGATVYNLDYKQGSSGPRQDFSEGYTFFVISTRGSDSNSVTLDFALIIPSIILLNSSATDPFTIPIPLSYRYASNTPPTAAYGISFARISDTTFRAGLLGQSGEPASITGSGSSFRLTKIRRLETHLSTYNSVIPFLKVYQDLRNFEHRPRLEREIV